MFSAWLHLLGFDPGVRLVVGIPLTCGFIFESVCTVSTMTDVAKGETFGNCRKGQSFGWKGQMTMPGRLLFFCPRGCRRNMLDHARLSVALTRHSNRVSTDASLRRRETQFLAEISWVRASARTAGR